MAAFTAEDPTDRDAFMARWRKLLGTETVTIKTVLLDGQVAGRVASFGQDGEREVTYWIGKEHWGKGVATGALRTFLDEEETRPIYARAAKDNAGSTRVLEKCGSRVSGEDRGFANARGEEIGEFILRLAAGDAGR